VLAKGAGRAEPELAAFLNATAGSFLELDEGMRPTGHPAMQVLPAALAVAETVGAAGTDLLHAVLAGYEVTSRLFRAYKLRYPVHPHGHLGAVGAAVAAALLSGTDPMEAATIAAATPILSIWDAAYEGATTRNTWMGLAAQTGVRATRLARAGFTGSRDALPAAFREIAGELVSADVLAAPLDYANLGITRNYFKRHSACALSHAAIDAVLSLDLPPVEEIRRVLVETVSNNLKLDRPAQPNELSTRFSLPYAVAAVISTGRSDPSAFQYDPRVARLAKRVEIFVAPDLEARWPDSSPARVTVESTTGETHAQVDDPVGYHSNPMSVADLRAKFLANADSGGGDALWDRLTNLDGVADCAELFNDWL
jgi:2-methylcitrate dehydratase PrpD